MVWYTRLNKSSFDKFIQLGELLLPICNDIAHMVEGFANVLLLSIGKFWNIDTFYIVVYLQIMKPSCPVFKCSRSTIAIIRIKGIENILRQPFFWVLNAKQSGEIVKEVFVFFTLEENHTTDRLLITSA